VATAAKSPDMYGYLDQQSNCTTFFHGPGIVTLNFPTKEGYHPQQPLEMKFEKKP
jgi:hypothetical protein